MSTLSISLALAIRIALVLLFLPFSALDKVFDFRGAVAQAQEAVSNKTAATALILVGLFVEVFMSAGVVCGVADRACAFVLAGYCALRLFFGSSFGAPVTFGFQAPARRARCSGIFGRIWLWPLAFFSSSSGQMRPRSHSSSPIRRFNPIHIDYTGARAAVSTGILAHCPILAYLDRRRWDQPPIPVRADRVS